MFGCVIANSESVQYSQATGHFPTIEKDFINIVFSAFLHVLVNNLFGMLSCKVTFKRDEKLIIQLCYVEFNGHYLDLSMY